MKAEKKCEGEQKWQVPQEKFRTIDGPIVFFKRKILGLERLFQYFTIRTENTLFLRRDLFF